MKYEIQGENLPVVICQLADGEAMRTEGGSMVWMTPNMEMRTEGGGLGGGKADGGEALYLNVVVVFKLCAAFFAEFRVARVGVLTRRTDY